MGKQAYQGKYRKHRRIHHRWWSALVIVLLLVAMGTGGVVAFLSTKTGQLTNTFAADASTDPTIVETFVADVKQNVRVDVGEPGYEVYVRAAVVVTWKGTDGNVLGKMPVAGTDYSIDYNEEGWFCGNDGFYYHKESVAYDGNDDTSKLTSSLIESCTPVVGKTPVGYGLNVEIIAQTIQALGTTDETKEYPNGVPAVTDAWGIRVDADGKLIKP